MSRGHPQLEFDASSGRVQFVPLSPFGLIVEALVRRVGADGYEVAVAEDGYGKRTGGHGQDGQEKEQFDGIVGMVQRGVRKELARRSWNVVVVALLLLEGRRRRRRWRRRNLSAN